MKIESNCATAIVAILFLFVTCSNSEALDLARRSLFPNCIFGVESISYILHTRDNVNGIRMNMHDNTFFRGRRVVIHIHGFISQANNSEYFSFAEAWLQQEDVNIISVDWDDAACNGGLSVADALSYESAVKNVPVVGRYIAHLTENLSRVNGIAITDIIVVGHSLGAHVAGFAGKYIQELVPGDKYAVILGLDPAGPSYRGKKCEDRLCISDATHVIAIHTSRTFGFHHPIAHADFYFNGGSSQPKCHNVKRIFCDHTKAVIYAKQFVLQPDCYRGIRWQLDSRNVRSASGCNPSICAHAGLNAVYENAGGIYYVKTSTNAPYCNA